MGMTRSLKSEFAKWILATLTASKQIIISFNPNVVFDVDGNVENLTKKDVTYTAEFGQIAVLDQAKIAQVKLVNVVRDDYYDTASAVADGISGYLGKNHPLSILIHQKRDSMVNTALRGKKPPKE